MKNPWTLDSKEVPNDAGVGQDQGGIELAGAMLWGSLLAFGGALLFTDLASGDAEEIITTTATLLASVALVVAVGWLAYFVLTRLSLFGQVLFGVGMLAFLFVVLPFFFQLLLDRTDLLSGLSQSLSLRDPFQGVVNDSIGGSLEEPLGDLLPSQ